MAAMLEQGEYSPEELLNRSEYKGYELIEGRLVERNMGLAAAMVAGELFRRMANHCRDHALGWVFPGGDAGYQGLAGSTRTVRKPDVSSVRFGRFENEEVPKGWAQLAPDLAVEVISPNDLYEDVDKKIEVYIRGGVRLQWVISPENHTVRIYRLDGTCASLRDGDELSGEDVVPGFRTPVSELFTFPTVRGNGTGG